MIQKLLDIYNRLMLKLFVLPFINVDRERFLRRQVDDPDSAIDAAAEQRRSRALVVMCCIVTSLITFLCTLPSNVWVSIPLIVLDFAQFQMFVFLIQQVLLYLHGYRDLRNDRRICDDNGLFLLWLQNEVMLSSGDSIRSKIKSGVGFVVRKSLTLLVTKSPFRMVVLSGMRQLLKWCGVIATHQLLDVSIDILVCVLCALIAALVSLWQFYPMCRKLRKTLDATDINYYYQHWRDYIDAGHTAEEAYNKLSDVIVSKSTVSQS
ncbi:MAG: hypothetical protein IIT83_04310 [Bacteroidales bacterium]|nr:hypothetical protein [Bacteroidales bacterium]MBQ5575102.1 hypothetical protein [Bacteroidales bacterium]